MSLILDGTNGLSDVDGSAATPAIRGTDANTGIFFPAADTIAFSEGGTEVMRIDSSGNVGIGTTTPQSKLQVGSVNAGTSESTNKGLVQIQSAPSTIDSAGGLEFKTSSSGSGYGWKIGGLNNTGDPFVIGNRSNSATFTECARIDSSGNLLVGTTSNFNNGKISVVTANAILTGTISAGSGAGIGIDFQRTAANGDIAYFRSTTGLAGFITITGANTCTYNSVSDVRLKENIVDAPSALAKVESLQVRSFDWKDGTGAVPYGFIAQELDEVVPEAVSHGTTSEDGSMLTPWGIDTSLLVPYLTKAIQEQQAIIEQLKARLDAANL